jgi:hypothetical protein
VSLAPLPGHGGGRAGPRLTPLPDDR